VIAKNLPLLFAAMLSVACVLTGVQSPKAAVPVRSSVALTTMWKISFEESGVLAFPPSSGFAGSADSHEPIRISPQHHSGAISGLLSRGSPIRYGSMHNWTNRSISGVASPTICYARGNQRELRADL
jgi:hypothetical protein